MPDFTTATRPELLRAADELDAEATYRERLQPHVANQLGVVKMRVQVAALRAAAELKRRKRA